MFFPLVPLLPSFWRYTPELPWPPKRHRAECWPLGQPHPTAQVALPTWASSCGPPLDLPAFFGRSAFLSISSAKLHCWALLHGASGSAGLLPSSSVCKWMQTTPVCPFVFKKRMGLRFKSLPDLPAMHSRLAFRLDHVKLERNAGVIVRSCITALLQAELLGGDISMVRQFGASFYMAYRVADM